MKLRNVTPMLWVKDLDETIRFYREKFGFECTSKTQGWATLARDGVEVMVSLPNAHERFDKLQFTGSFYFGCDDARALWEQLKDRTTVVYPIEDFEYGMREFAVRDNTGYILQFGQELE
jgi:uncharacterized glyoxalase superfamily protein PhnB